MIYKYNLFVLPYNHFSRKVLPQRTPNTKKRLHPAAQPLLINPCPLLFDQRNRALDEIRQALALEHPVGQQRQVDDLLHEPVFTADLAQPLIALIAQRDDLLRQLLAHGFLFGGKLLLFLALGNLLEAVFLGHGRVDLLGDGLRDAFDPKLRGTE